MLTLQEVTAQLQPSQSVVVYTTKKDGLIVGYRLQNVDDHTHTTLIECKGDILPAILHEQYHGHARTIGERIMYANGARYFEAYWRNTYDKKIVKRNSGRIIRSHGY